MPIFQFENIEAMQSFISESQESTYDLSDLFIAQTASTYGCDAVLTFDKKAAKYKLFDLI